MRRGTWGKIWRTRIVDGNSRWLRREVAKRGRNGRKWMVLGLKPDPTLQCWDLHSSMSFSLHGPQRSCTCGKFSWLKYILITLMSHLAVMIGSPAAAEDCCGDDRCCTCTWGKSTSPSASDCWSSSPASAGEGALRFFPLKEPLILTCWRGAASATTTGSFPLGAQWARAGCNECWDRDGGGGEGWVGAVTSTGVAGPGAGCSGKPPRYDKPSLKVRWTVKDVSATSARRRQVTPNYSVSLEDSTSVCPLFKDQERVHSEE